MNIILASVKTLPNLINGKICVINDDGTYSLYNPAKNVIIEDGFNPERFSILNNPKYSKCIVYSTIKEYECYLVNKQIKRNYFPECRIGDRIHIHSRRGIYTVVSIDADSIYITCNKWKYDANPVHRIPKTDFRCLAGGIYNQTFD